MAQLIQRAPFGLLSLLDSKAGGIAPNLLADTVTGTVDIQPLYGLGLRRRQTASIAAAAAVLGVNNLGGFAVVPPTETWHVLNITGIVNNVIAAGVDWGVGYSGPGLVFSLIGDQQTTATGVRGITGGPCDVWLPPGAFVSIYLARTVAGADLIANWDYETYTL